jgi:UDP-N-acetylglucosamine transferase subunit ALG13
MARVLVTVGMGPWPFDRLIRAITRLCHEHEVFAQTGASSVTPPCPHERFVSFTDLQERIVTADVIITHAGNTVRLVQRGHKVPIAVARLSAFGEMGNDHQAAYLRLEEKAGPVVAVWDTRELPRAVAAHPVAQSRLLRRRQLASPATADHIIQTLDSLCLRLCRGPHGA